MKSRNLINIETGKVAPDGVDVMNFSVFTVSGKYLGKVKEVTLDDLGFALKSITVMKKFLIWHARRIITLQNIIEIVGKKIIVNDDNGYIFAGDTKKATLSLTDNAA